MQILLSGLRLLFENLIAVTAFFTTAAGLGLMVLSLMPASRRLSVTDKLLIAIPVGTVPLSLFSYGFIQLARVWQPTFAVASRLLLVMGMVFLLLFLRDVWKQKRTATDWGLGIAGILSFVLFLALRLAFLSNVVLPPYHDSVEHYRILLSFLDPVSTPSLFSGGYYHYGFHSIAAWLVEAAGVTPAQVLTLLGQFFLSLVPLSLYSLVHALTRDWKSALITAMVGAFFWAMPAHAANWGKYPALAAITILPGLLAVIIVVWQEKELKKKWLTVSLACAFLLTGITFMHSRGAICFALAVLCFLLDAVLVRRLSLKVTRIVAAVLAAAFLATIFLSTSILWLYATPILPFVFFGLAVIAAVIWKPRLTIGVSLWVLLLWVMTYVPAPGYFSRFSLTLIDTPFYQLLTFLPITLLTGLGLSSALEKSSVKRWLKISAWIGLGTLLLFAVLNQTYTPDDCCNYTSRDDLDVMNWMKENLPADAAVAIPGRYDLFPVVGADSGIWITQLTGRDTLMLPFDYTWFDKNIHGDVCELGVVYIYASASSLSFQIDPITHPDWYQPVYQKGGTFLYRVIGCNGD
jgi:hypothetical protein